MLVMSSFVSLSKNTAAGLGAISETCGVRPSELFEWSDPEDWMERLMFDMNVIKNYKLIQSEALQHADKN